MKRAKPIWLISMLLVMAAGGLRRRLFTRPAGAPTRIAANGQRSVRSGPHRQHNNPFPALSDTRGTISGGTGAAGISKAGQQSIPLGKCPGVFRSGIRCP